MRWLQTKRQRAEDLLGPFWSGFVDSIGSVVVLVFSFFLIWVSFSAGHPDAQLLRDQAQFGAALFIAFSVATAGAGVRVEDIGNHLKWIGSGCGIGLAGFLSIAIDIALAAYRESGYSSALDVIGLLWSSAALVLMGLTIAFLPYMAYTWRRPASD